MSEPIKIKEEELSELRMLQNKVNQKIIELGQLGAEKIELDRSVSLFLEKEKKLREEWVNIQKMEQELVDRLVKKYGEGELDIKEGTITPSISSNR